MERRGREGARWQNMLCKDLKGESEDTIYNYYTGADEGSSGRKVTLKKLITT